MIYNKKESQLLIRAGVFDDQLPELRTALINALRALAKETLHSRVPALSTNVFCLTEILLSIPFYCKKGTPIDLCVHISISQIPDFQHAICYAICQLVSNNDTMASIDHDVYLLTELQNSFSVSGNQLQRFSNLS